MRKATIKDFDFKGKKVFVRVDFNVPLKDGEVSDNTRIIRALPTIEYLVKQGAKVILASHLGNPKTDEDKENLNMDPVAKRFSELYGKSIKKMNSCIGEDVKKAISEMNESDIILLENTRFYKGEKKNDPDFSKELASLADVAVNDAFGTAHRAHASNVGVASNIECYAGFLMEKEIEMLGNTLENPERPFVAILGGAKVSSKIGVIDNLLEKVDALIIGGAMMFTFAKALGYNTGKSLVEEDKLDIAKAIIQKAEKLGKKLLLPIDAVCATEFKGGIPVEIMKIEDVKDDYMGLDIGPETIKIFNEEISKAKTIVWNGPMGVFEIQEYSTGTKKVAEKMAELDDSKTIIGGGDSAAAVNLFKLEDKMTHISTGGGASLEYMEGKVLPGVECIKNI